ncbi:MAG: radical SAM protein [Spirochaetales bacterium]|nr:radical SAM protein [Spirochaetales bacterium]
MAALKTKPRALLLFPPVYDFAAFDMFLRPFALLRLAAWLEGGGYEATLVNALDPRDGTTAAVLGFPKRYPDGTGKFFRRIVAKPAALASVPRHYARYGILRESIEEKIRAARPDVVLVGTGMTYWYPGAKEAVECARAAAPGAPVIAGGIYATLCPAHAAAALEADRVVAGPALPALAAVLGELGLPVPPGPLPDRPALIAAGYPGAAAVRLHAGCPLACDYCASSLVSGGFVPGRGEALFGFVRDVHEAFGLDHFAFYDDALLCAPAAGVIPFLEAVIESGLELRFHVPNGMHVAFVTEEIARLMKRAGVRDFKLGFESAAESFHAAHDGKHTPEQFARAIDALRAGGYKPDELAVYILAGLPGQLPGEVEESIRFAAGLGIQAHLAEYSPIPGTALWEQSAAASPFPIAEEPLTQNNTIFPLRSARFTPRRLQELKQLARRLTRSLR